MQMNSSSWQVFHLATCNADAEALFYDLTENSVALENEKSTHPLMFTGLNFDFEFHQLFDHCVKPWTRPRFVPDNQN
jgi:hypothetical protein